MAVPANEVVAAVVQPGVEYGDDMVFKYNRPLASDLSREITRHKSLVYEAHSTDYQSEADLKALVEDHFCILKVGPWLTFAYREALFALESVEIEILGERNQEYSEIEFYYTSQINSKYHEIQNTDLEEDQAFKEDMLKEISDMDSVYKQLQEEMGNNPGDERIVEAMIRHYQTKLRVITEILNRLEKYQNLNSNNNQNQYESVKL